MPRPNAGDDSNPRSGEGGPRHTPAALAADPAFTGTYAQVVGLTGAGIDLTGTADSTAALNALLAASAGKVAKGVPGSTYQITAPLVLRSGTTLDMTGCTVVLATGSNCNMVQNYAVGTSQRSVTDAAITSGAATLTSATANFTSADVGRTVVVAGAGPNAGGFALSAVITARTDATTVTVNVAAGATVSGATATIYDRDTNIRILGGTWNRGSNAGTGDQQHSIFLRRIDGLTVNIDTFISTGSGPKYAVHPGDVTNFDLSVKTFSHVSDGIHVRGPASNGVIHNVGGSTQDDFVVLGASDNTRVSGGGGDITDVAIYDLRPVNLTNTKCCAKLYGNTGTNVKRVNIDGIRGSSTVGAVNLGATDITGVTLSEITVQNVVTDHYHAIICNANGDALRARNITSTSASAVVADLVNVAAGATWGLIDIQGLGAPGFASAAGGSALVQVLGTVTDLMVGRTKVTAPASGCVALLNGASAAVTRLFLEDVSLAGGSSTMVKAPTSGQTLGEVYTTRCYATGSSFLLDTAATTIWHISGVRFDSPANGSCNVRATANLTILGQDASKISGSVTTATGYALRVDCPDLRVDIGKITTQGTGDRAFNSAAATGVLPGSGPVVYDGAAWKRADLGGAVKQGTATLVAGTVTVSDAAVTNNTLIRVYPKTLGGTPGALYISARTAATGFTITSTSGTDTSVVQYDIVQY